MSSRQAVRLPWMLAGALSLVCVALASSQQDSRSARAADQAQATASPTSEGKALLEQFSAAFQDASRLVNPSVVPILSERKVAGNQFSSGPDDPFGGELLRRFFGNPGRMPRGEQTLQNLGSGVIVSEDGYILTNNHVIQDADKLTVVTADNEKHEAKVIGRDPETDVAVIKIAASGLSAASLGDSDHLQVGQWVIAVGNPLQMMHSVTAGIVSATGRSSIGLADYEDFIQTDASINPGNSGGALADLDGRVVGINTAIASPTGVNVGIGFAIPINMARKIMNDLIDGGRISRGYLGVSLQPLDRDLATGLGLEFTKGALVGDVSSDSAAERGGIRRGDVIVGFDGEDVQDAAQLKNLVAGAKPGARLAVRLVRDRKEKELNVTLAERPSQTEAGQPESGRESGTPKLGLSLRDLTPDLARQLGIENVRGVLVQGVEPSSPAEAAGVRRGDVVLAVGRAEVGSTQELRDALSELHEGDTVVLLVKRGQNTFYVAIKPS